MAEQQEKPKEEEDILSANKHDRRLLSRVPDAEGARTNTDRRGIAREALRSEDFLAYIASEQAGQRYDVSYDVKVVYRYQGKGHTLTARCIDISTTGLLLVMPQDIQAPKGRLILPQVQVLREVLDGDGVAFTVKDRELEAALHNLRKPPAVVITDSQVILKVSGDVPDDVPLTTFSTLFARYKGDLTTLAAGAAAIDRLRDGDVVLMAEACSHHVQSDDIGRVKIPRWISQYTGRDLTFEMHAGHDFPDDLERYALVVHCGSCMFGRMEMLRRIRECVRRGVPVTNYGVAISKVQGVLDRVLAPVLR